MLQEQLEVVEAKVLKEPLVPQEQREVVEVKVLKER